MSSITTPAATAPSAVTPTGCCPPFDPSTWHDKEITWTDKLFVKERVHGLFHVPLDIAPKVRRAMRRIEDADAEVEHPLMLSDELSPWRSDLYIDVTGPVPGAQTGRLSGTFLTRVYEGPYRDAPKWSADMAVHAAARGRHVEKIYFGYVMCPKCAKAYGKNYVVLFARVAPGPAPATAS